MTIHEQEAEEALGKWSSSKYAIFTRTKKHHLEMILDEGTNQHPEVAFDARITPQGEKGQRADPSKYWDSDGLRIPAGYGFLAIYSKAALKTGQVMSRAILPDLTGYDTASLWVSGFELGSGLQYGIKAMRLDQDDNFFCRVGGPGAITDAYIENLLPTDFHSTRYLYTVKNNSGFTEFFVDDDLKAVIVEADREMQITANNTPPYVVKTTRAKPPTTIPTLLEFNAGGEEATADLEPKEYRFAEGKANPPRTYRLYDWEADTLLTSGTYDTGTSYKSHPIPTVGYSAKAFLFRADTDSTTDGLAVEVLTQEGNWRTYLTRTYSANTLESIEPTGEFPLMRLAYEPSADGASITDAEVVVR